MSENAAGLGTVLMLAGENGVKHERWQADTPKQLIEIRGETLISRAFRLLAAYTYRQALLITDHPLLAHPLASCRWPSEHHTKAHSLLALRDTWGAGDLLVLYSDVYYSEAAFHTVATTTGTHFFGRGGRSAYTHKNYGELFAIRIAAKDHARAEWALREAIAHFEQTGNQSFWVFYRLMAGLPVQGKALEHAYFVSIHDETDDLDFAHEVELLTAAVDKPLSWRLRYVWRSLSLWNKRRRERARGRRRSLQRG